MPSGVRELVSESVEARAQDPAAQQRRQVLQVCRLQGEVALAELSMDESVRGFSDQARLVANNITVLHTAACVAGGERRGHSGGRRGSRSGAR